MVTGHFDLGITNRIAASGSLGWISTKYDGNAPWNLDIDDGQWHSTFQDASAQVRGVLLAKPVRLVPYVHYQFPTSSYATIGHAAPGRRNRGPAHRGSLRIR